MYGFAVYFFPVYAFGAMIVWAVVSLINSYDKVISLYGYEGRGEGLFAIVFYAGFFITASAVKNKKPFKSVIYGIVGTGLLNSVIGIIQVFTGKISNYKSVALDLKIYAASGFSQSPLFLAMFLTLAIIAALMGFMNENSKGKKIFFIVCSCIFSFVMIFTYSLIGICGLVLSIVFAVVSAVVTKVPKINILSVLSVIVPAVTAVVIVNTVGIGDVTSYRLYDGRILWWADSYMRISASGEPDSRSVDIDDTYDVYYTLNTKTIDIIERYGLTGTGPDQLAFPQIYNVPEYAESLGYEISDIIAQNRGIFDRVYNEYLYTASTRGIPSLIVLVIILISEIVSGFGKVKKEHSWEYLCMFLMTLAGILIFLIGCSNTAFSPVFWSVAGLVNSTAFHNLKDSVQENSDKKEKSE